MTRSVIKEGLKAPPRINNDLWSCTAASRWSMDHRCHCVQQPNKVTRDKRAILAQECRAVSRTVLRTRPGARRTTSSPGWAKTFLLLLLRLDHGTGAQWHGAEPSYGRGKIDGDSCIKTGSCDVLVKINWRLMLRHIEIGGLNDRKISFYCYSWCNYFWEM